MARVSRQKWFRFTWMLWSAFPEIDGSYRMSIRIQHTLNTEEGHHIFLTSNVHDKMNPWRYFITSLAERSMHLGGIWLSPPTWIRDMDALLKRMGGICSIPSGKWFIWQINARNTNTQRLLTENNPGGDLTINDIKLVTYVAHLNIFTTLMEPLENIATKVDKTAE